MTTAPAPSSSTHRMNGRFAVLPTRRSSLRPPRSSTRSTKLPFEVCLHSCAGFEFINAVLEVLQDRLRTFAFLLPTHKGPPFPYHRSSVRSTKLPYPSLFRFGQLLSTPIEGSQRTCFALGSVARTVELLPSETDHER